MKMGYVLGGAIVVAGIAAFVVSGAQRTTPTPETPQPAAASAAQSPAGAQPVAPEAPSEGFVVAGEVLETMDAGGYTYMRIGKTGTEGQWVAVAATKVEKGQQVSVRADTEMRDFESPTLKRKFASIRFGSMAAANGNGTPAAAGATPPGHPPMGGSAAAGPMPPGMGHGSPTAGATDVKVGNVEKAAGGYNIAEIFAQKAALAGKMVKVRATVVKVTSGILGKNFAHVRDGSGSEAKKDHDLTVTTTDPLAQGQTVMLEGKLALDRDIGAGYKYDVLLEDAKIVK